MEEMKKNNSLMAGKGESGKWITVKGSHIFVEDGQSVDEAMEKHFSKSGNTSKVKTTDKAVKVDTDTGWEEGQLTGDSARFNKFLRLAHNDADTQSLIDELKNIGLNEKGISAVWNADSIYGKDAKQQDRELMSIFNNPEYRAEPNYKNTKYEDNEEIDWDRVKQNEKVNAKNAKNPKRHDKYGNELLSDEAFNVGLEAGKSYLNHMTQFHDLNQLKRSNVFLGNLQTIVSNSIVNNGFNPNLDTTYQDFNEIIGNLLGEEVDLQQYEGRQGSGFTGRKYIGYKPANN